MTGRREPIAIRQLTWANEDRAQTVTVRLWQPAFYETGFFCDFVIDGLPVPMQDYGEGVDSFQALVSAITGIRFLLAPYRDALSWLGEIGHHVPLITDEFDDGLQRRIEELVDREIEAHIEFTVQNANAYESNLRQKYDPDGDDTVLDKLLTDELIEHLRRVSAQMIAFREANNDEAVLVFSQKRFSIIRALRKRPESTAVLRSLTTDGDRAIRLLAAQFLSPNDGKITLERLRDEQVEPEASEANCILAGRARRDARPKPWDDPRPSKDEGQTRTAR